MPNRSQENRANWRRSAAVRVFAQPAFAEPDAHALVLNFISPLSANKKSPTRKWGATPHPFSRRVPAPKAWEGVLTYGVSPITVAGSRLRLHTRSPPHGQQHYV